jgi:hypothetical protein
MLLQYIRFFYYHFIEVKINYELKITNYGSIFKLIMLYDNS